MQSHLEHPLRKLPYPLTTEALEPSASKDEICVALDEDFTALRSGRAERPVYVYYVTNKTNEHEYTVELLEDDLGRPCAWDNCRSARGLPEWSGCKHVKAALKDLLQRVPTFGEKVFKTGGGKDHERLATN